MLATTHETVLVRVEAARRSNWRSWSQSQRLGSHDCNVLPGIYSTLKSLPYSQRDKWVLADVVEVEEKLPEHVNNHLFKNIYVYWDTINGKRNYHEIIKYLEIGTWIGWVSVFSVESGSSTLKLGDWSRVLTLSGTLPTKKAHGATVGGRPQPSPPAVASPDPKWSWRLKSWKSFFAID